MNQTSDFHIQASVLNNFIHMDDPHLDPIGVKVVLKKIKHNGDLRNYFFGQRPSAGWAPIFLKEGFFNDPPSVEKTDGGYRTHFWDLSSYLRQVAGQVPDVVLEVCQKLETDNPNIHADLIYALAEIDGPARIDAEPRLIEWLENEYANWSVIESSLKFINKLIEDSENRLAFALADKLMHPIRHEIKLESIPNYRYPAQSRFERHHILDELWTETVRALINLDAVSSLQIFQAKLIEALHLEFDENDGNDVHRVNQSYWRVSIEGSSLDDTRDYKEVLVNLIRDTLLSMFDTDLEKAKEISIAFSKHEYVIFQRIALFIVGEKANYLAEKATSLLVGFRAYDDIYLHAELFLLLKKAFGILSPEVRQRVLQDILKGPPPTVVEKWENRLAGDLLRVEQRKKVWVLDRLWMIQSQLDAPTKRIVDDLVLEFGAPDRPELLIKTSEAFFVRDVSPIDAIELNAMTDMEIIEYINSWKPSENDFGPEQVSVKGLAEQVASIFLEDKNPHAKAIPLLINVDPVYSAALFFRSTDLIRNRKDLPLNELFDLGTKLSRKVGKTEATAWRGARQAAIWFAHHVLEDKKDIGNNHSLRSFVFSFLNDPDPDEIEDTPQEGMVGFRDPITLSLNTIRPVAFSCLFLLIRGKEGPLSSFAEIKVAIENKFDEKSVAVRSIYGRYARMLFRLDPSWFAQNREGIFFTKDPKSWFFIGAMDYYLISGVPRPDMYRNMGNEYRHYIQNVADGKTSNTHLGTKGALAQHLIAGSLINSAETLMQDDPLVGNYFSLLDEHARGSFVLNVANFLKSCLEDDKVKYWASIKAFWEWRVSIFSTTQKPNSFNSEFEYFSLFPILAPSFESIVTLYPLLLTLLPFSTGYGVWSKLTEYLANQVDQYPEKVIVYFRRMHDYKQNEMRMSRKYDESTDKILEICAKNTSTRKAALKIADIVFRAGNNRYTYLINTYT